MTYQYDVFFSYKRDVQSDAWHRVVMEKLQFLLKLELGCAKVPIFFDTEEIHSGQRWRSKLADALKASKTIVCIWSPLYFQSQWCISEWKTFTEREKKFNRVLVIPARYHDGESFPQEAQDTQSMDMSNYSSTMESFWKTAMAVDFEKNCLEPFAKEVANVIRNVPPFKPDFPLFEFPANQLIPQAGIGRPAND